MLSRYRLLLALVALLLLSPTLALAQAPLVTIDRPGPRELRMEGFELPSPATVEITAAVPVTEHHAYPLGDAWMLNAATREVVWTLDTADFYEADDALRTTTTRLDLPAGAFEVYFASFPLRASYGDRWEGGELLSQLVENLVDEIFRRDRSRWRAWEDWEDVYRTPATRAAGITVSGPGAPADQPRRLADAFQEHVFFSLAGLADDRYLHQGFEVDAPVELDLYAIGEMHRHEAHDFAWIADVETGRRVWTMDYDRTDPAGGAEKNRVANELLRLEPGRYAAFVVTDDSHSPQRWNAAPPYDPTHWGLTVLVPDPAHRAHVELFEYTPADLSEALVALRGIRDDAHASNGFALAQPLEVRVYALGEGDGGAMYDYGWIENAETGQVVWEMTYRTTEHAGGARKNRAFDGTLQLPPGRYVAHYVTDGSHAHGDWNSSPPYDQEAWGLTVLPVGPAPDGAVAAYAPYADAAVVGRITGDRDDLHRRERFRLEAPAALRIQALGEGDGGEMYDYGWIENAETGQVVWEMTYRMTEHAGGAHKNRRVDTALTLPPGDYVLHYVTDGSHHFGDWNSRPPRNQAAWGITLRRAD